MPGTASMLPPDGATVQIDFTLAVGSGTLQASADVPAGSVTLTEFLPVLQTLSSNIIGGVVEIVAAEGFPISCKAGCGACCRQIVPISLFEAEYLAGWIRTLPAERQDALALRFDNALTALRDSGILARMEQALYDSSEAAHALGIDYLAEGVACPFLEDESCSIHPIRPLICREYLVASPPAFCVKPTRESVIPIPMPIKLSNTLYTIGGAIQPGTRGILPLVLLFAWMKSGGTPGKAVVATGPEHLRGILEMISRKSTGPAGQDPPDATSQAAPAPPPTP